MQYHEEVMLHVFYLGDAQKDNLVRVRFRTLRYSKPPKIC